MRDNIRGSLPGADATVPNSVLRVLSDNQGGLCHLTLQYIDWLALQLLPDTAETEWLDRHADIWLVNADGSTGRKVATLAEGSATFTGVGGTVVPQATRIQAANGIAFETTETITLGTTATPATIRAIDPGAAGNLLPGAQLSLAPPLENVDSGATVIELYGGADEESDDDLRVRILQRIQQPPMGGAVHDYVAWALDVPGVTRAWAASEMGIGTVTVRFMMDDLRAANDGFPLPADERAVEAYIDIMRPVTVKDFWTLAPLKHPIDVNINALNPDTAAVRAAIQASVEGMLREKAAPGQTIYAAWKSEAISNAAGVVSFTLTSGNDVMPSPGHMALLGDIYYVGV